MTFCVRPRASKAASASIMCDFIASNGGNVSTTNSTNSNNSKHNGHRVVLLGSSKVKCQQSKSSPSASNSASSSVGSECSMSRRSSASSGTGTLPPPPEEAADRAKGLLRQQSILSGKEQWPVKNGTSDSKGAPATEENGHQTKDEDCTITKNGTATESTNSVESSTTTTVVENEHLLVEIVTLNRALIAAREGNLKLLQVSTFMCVLFISLQKSKDRKKLKMMITDKKVVE